MSEETTAKVQFEEMHGGALWRLTLDAPKGNVIDGQMTRELSLLFEQAVQARDLKVVVLSATGDHFSFGASVEEHQPKQVQAMLAGFHALFAHIAASSVPVLAAVQGSCLGGGLELVAYCQRVFAHPASRFGQPEIKLGVFAPVASAILAERVGRAAADDLLLSGRTVNAQQALAMSLVESLDDDPDAAALDYAAQYLLPHSASSLRIATRAARFEFQQRFERVIRELERLYLSELMTSEDAVEGITAFLEKRKPEWRNR